MTTAVRGTSPVEAIRAAAEPLTGGSHDYDALLDRIGDARFVLLGEASHGTHEFYNERARITRRLIEDKGFNAVAVEADWPDAYQINRYVRGIGDGTTVAEALGGFTRFPLWMWRNRAVLDFVAWLREHNGNVPQREVKVGFYGLDLYSLHASIDAVIGYLDRVDPEAARRARERYSCLEHFGQDPQQYGLATYVGSSEPCEDEVVAQMVELTRRAADYAQSDGQLAEDEFFFAEQNARLVVNAEEYYRSMFRGRESSWNLRDTHMVDTLDALTEHLRRTTGEAKVVVWAHNSHLGDARATEMGEGGELNVGQLVRERHDGETFLVGFTTYTGTVTAAGDWGMPAERLWVRPGMAGSVEALFHEADIPAFLLPLRGGGPAEEALREPLLERAIGVVYRPQTERWSHYFHARLPRQFDAVLHFDETRAVEPLDRTSGWDQGEGEMPDTYPTGV